MRQTRWTESALAKIANGWEVREFAVAPTSDVTRFYQRADGAVYLEVDGRADIGGIIDPLASKPIRIVCAGIDGKRWGDSERSAVAVLS